jgi:hypothetical protein
MATKQMRTYVKVAGMCGQKSDTQIRRWAQKYRWQERVLSFDNYEVREEHKRQVREAAAMKRRQANLGLKVQEIALERLNSMTPEQIKKLPAATVAKLVEIGTKRRAHRARRGRRDASASHQRHHRPPAAAERGGSGARRDYNGRDIDE